MLLDENITGFGQLLLHIWASAGLTPFWDDLRAVILVPADIGLTAGTSDREVWHRCQSAGYVLLTDNRTRVGRDSLGQTLADSLRPDSLPVLTVGSKDRFLRDRNSARVVAAELLDTLLDIAAGRHRGLGRMFLPRTAAS